MNDPKPYELHNCPSDTCGNREQVFRLDRTERDADDNETNYYICTNCEIPPPGKRLTGHMKVTELVDTDGSVTGPVVVLDRLCIRHRPKQTFAVQARDDQDRVMDILTCGRCWRADEQTLMDLCASLKLSESDIRVVRRRALGSGLQ